MKTPEQRGPIGMWIRTERLAKGWSQARAVKALDDSGHPIADTTYRLFESGNRRPGPDSLQALEKLFGSTAPAPDAGTQNDLIRALWAQTEAINGLGERLELIATTQQAQTEGMVSAVLDLVTLLRPVGPPGESPPQPSAGARP